MKNKFISKAEREKLINSNQWLEKLLFMEVPKRDPTAFSEVFILRRELRANGDVVFLPTRTNIENLPGGGGGGQVNTVVGGTDISVDATDPVNPIVNFTGTLGGQVNTVVGTTDEISVNIADPVNPVVSLAAAVIASLALADSAIQAGNTILDGMYGLIQAVTDTTYTLMLRAAYAGAITAVGTRMGVGTCTVEIQIGGTPLGGSSNSATTTYSEQAHATDNVFVVNDIITMVITASAASPADLDFVLKMVRIL